MAEPRVADNLESPIPDFCRGRAIVLLAFQLELVAVVLTLANVSSYGNGIYRLIVVSLYLQWLGLCAAAALCMARRWLRYARPGVVFFLCWMLLLILTLVISDIAYAVATTVLHESLAPVEGRREFVIRHLCISAIVSLMLLRYFWTRNQWRSQVKAEGEARYQALHARIRPHFLFNALNSLAALISIKPQAAEEMVEDLADLFRVSLDARQRLVPLSEELDLVRSYMRIEQTRLGARLGIEWDVPAELMRTQVPLLTIQPLVENAVYHGVAKLRGNATIRVHARRDKRWVWIEVSNPLPPADSPSSHGTQHAVGNIAERLRLIYGDQAALKLGHKDGLFRAQLKLPWVQDAAEDAPP